MRWILNFTLATVALVTLFWTIAIWTETGSSGIAVLGWFAVVVVVYAAGLLIGAIVAWRRPPLRRRATLLMAMPLIGGIAPYLLRALSGGPVEIGFVSRVVSMALALASMIALVRPRATASRLPGRLFRSRWLNLAIVYALVIAWSVLMLAAVWVMTEAGQNAVQRANRTSNDMASAYIILAASAYLLLIGAGSVIAAAWGWLGLMGGVEGARRRIHIAQLAGALPGILIAAATWAWLLTQR
jgi:hypothetical protein